MVALLVWDQEVAGSSPVFPTKIKKMEIDLKHQNYNKFNGVAPEGMILVPYEFLEALKDFDLWKEFKYSDSKWVMEKCSEIMDTANKK